MAYAPCVTLARVAVATSGTPRDAAELPAAVALREDRREKLHQIMVDIHANTRCHRRKNTVAGDVAGANLAGFHRWPTIVAIGLI